MRPPAGSARRLAATCSFSRLSSASASNSSLRARRYSLDSPGKWTFGSRSTSRHLFMSRGLPLRAIVSILSSVWPSVKGSGSWISHWNHPACEPFQSLTMCRFSPGAGTEVRAGSHKVWGLQYIGWLRFRSLPTSPAVLWPVPFTRDSYHQRSVGCCCQLDDDCCGQPCGAVTSPPPESPPRSAIRKPAAGVSRTPLSEDRPWLPGPVASDWSERHHVHQQARTDH